MREILVDMPKGPTPILIRDNVLLHFEAYRQRSWFAKEAGGQLFVRLLPNGGLDLCEITGPRCTDRRARFHYVPDRVAERIEIAERYSQGYYFIGDWHTHAQDRPKPSGTDLDSMQEMADLSTHGFLGFLLIIVGRRAFPEGLHVSFHTKREWERLIPRLPSAV